MNRAVGNGGGGDSRLRHIRHLHHLLDKEKGFDLSNFLVDNRPTSPDQPESASSLRRQVAASLMQYHRAIERNNYALQPASPASYGSSLEVVPYNPAATPSSIDFKGRIGEPHYSFKTSTELLKVLNRIWSLEEQHASNISLIKSLKTELEHACVRIKELLRDKQTDRHELDDLMKQIAEDKLLRKSKEQDRIHAAVNSMKDELEDERKLRKRSESLHRKLARELSEAKSSFSNSLKELERERKSRKLLEDLCDEFARGIKEYEQEVHSLKKKSEMDWVGRSDHDCLILYISESWLDERMQMNLKEGQCGFADKNSIVDKLSLEIETFLQTKRMTGTSTVTDNLLPRDRRNSLESVPLNEVVSAPQDVSDEDFAGTDSNCFELNKRRICGIKPNADEALGDCIDETVKSNYTSKNLASRESIRSRVPSSLQVKFEEQIALAMSCDGEKKSPIANTKQGQNKEENPIEMNSSRKFENCEAIEVGSYETKSKHDEIDGSSSNCVDNLIRSQISLSEAGNIHPENDCSKVSCSYSSGRNHAGPVRRWMAKLTTPDIGISESSSKLSQGLKENTLKAKLLGARSKGQRSHLKAFKGSS